MLFDLRGRGRRRAVQAIYLSLAILMGGGLVLFGVGGATSGGLLDAFKADSGQTDVNKQFEKRVNAAEAAVKARPTDPNAWAALTRVRYLEASSGDSIDSTGQAYTEKGLGHLREADAAYTKYDELTKGHPSDTVATLMVQAYAQTGLNQPDKAVSAMEDVIAKRKATGPLYVQLAALAYQANQTRKAQLASAKAISLTPKDDREQIQAQLDSLKQQAAAAAASSTTPSTTSPTG
jgi:tetratricopeptide (TPR) repeat protein